MKPIRNSFAPLILGLIFIASIASTGCAVRYYDADHRDYHRWDGDEDRAYREYWRERYARERYLEYAREAAEFAMRSHDAGMRAAFENVARSWERLAREIEDKKFPPTLWDKIGK